MPGCLVEQLWVGISGWRGGQRLELDTVAQSSAYRYCVKCDGSPRDRGQEEEPGAECLSTQPGVMAWG